jgi:hypothetical protein
METVSLETLRETLLSRNARGEDGDSWAGMAREYGVNPAVLWRIAHEGYEPRKAETRDRLGLPEIVQREVWRDAKGRYRQRGDRDA